MSTNAKVSKLPWTVTHGAGVIDNEGEPVSLYEHLPEVVLAVNAHEALVDALEAVQKWDRCEPGRKQLFWPDVQSAIDAALRLANGGGA